MNRLGKVGSMCLLTALCVQSAVAGRLGDVEKKASKKSEPAKPPAPAPAPAPAQARGYDSASTSSFGTGTYPSAGVGESFLTAMFGWLVSSPFDSRHEEFDETYVEEEGWAQPANPFFPAHRTGAMTQPYVRADFNYQYIEDDLTAKDLRIEAGYKMFAFHGRHTLYEDGLPDADPPELTINQYYGMLRLGAPVIHRNGGESYWEVDAGLGVAQQSGNEENSSWAITIPVKYQYNEFIGAEFRPAWYRWSELMIGDYDASVSLGWRFVQLRGGYRWLWMQSAGHVLNGPYAGVSIAF